MAQDFARRKTARKRKTARRSKTEPWRFSLGSFVLGVVAAAGLFLLGAYGPELLLDRQPHNPLSEASSPATQEPRAQQRTARDLSPPGRRPQREQSTAPPGDTSEDGGLKFVFRDLLGEDQVDPDISAYEVDVTAGQEDLPMQYLLQSGSFQIKSDAESRRGALLLMNLPASVVEAQIDNRIWYRVIVGPYAQRGEAQQAVSRLQANEIKTIWLERPVDAT